MSDLSKGLPICTFYGNECFYRKFHNQTYKAENCNCLTGCNEVRYKYYVDAKRPFSSNEVKEFCQISRPHYQYIRQQTVEPNFDVSRLKNFSLNSTYETIEVCERYVKTQFARVRIQMDGTSYLRRIQSLKYQTSDKFAIVGGTMGLFSGFSFIAIFEIIHWTMITLFKLFWTKGRKPAVLPEKIQEDQIQQTLSYPVSSKSLIASH